MTHVLSIYYTYVFHGSTGLHNDVLGEILHELRPIGKGGAASEVNADTSSVCAHMSVWYESPA